MEMNCSKDQTPYPNFFELLIKFCGNIYKNKCDLFCLGQTGFLHGIAYGIW